MKKGFWKELNKPIMALAPMANVSDAAFRRIIADCGKPDIFWTEFVSVEALLSKGREIALVDFWYTEKERPIVAQIFGSKPEQFKEVAKLCKELGFDGIDINMGCPDRGVEKSGAGAALIKDPELAKKIILATKEGAGDLPVSVKTRIGYSKNEIESWLRHLLEVQPAAITMHARSRKDMSKVPANWDLIKRMVEIVAEEISKEDQRPILLGNGDVENLEQGRVRVEESGADGVMLGRGIFGNPWLFSEHSPDIKEKLETMLEHSKLFEELFGKNTGEGGKRLKNFSVMKKHYKAYVNGFDGAKELRIKLMEAEDYEEVEKVTHSFIKTMLP